MICIALLLYINSKALYINYTKLLNDVLKINYFKVIFKDQEAATSSNRHE